MLVYELVYDLLDVDEVMLFIELWCWWGVFGFGEGFVGDVECWRVEYIVCNFVVYLSSVCELVGSELDVDVVVELLYGVVRVVGWVDCFECDECGLYVIDFKIGC